VALLLCSSVRACAREGAGKKAGAGVIGREREAAQKTFIPKFFVRESEHNQEEEEEEEVVVMVMMVAVVEGEGGEGKASSRALTTSPERQPLGHVPVPGAVRPPGARQGLSGEGALGSRLLHPWRRSMTCTDLVQHQ